MDVCFLYAGYFIISVFGLLEIVTVVNALRSKKNTTVSKEVDYEKPKTEQSNLDKDLAQLFGCEFGMSFILSLVTLFFRREIIKRTNVLGPSLLMIMYILIVFVHGIYCFHTLDLKNKSKSYVLYNFLSSIIYIVMEVCFSVIMIFTLIGIYSETFRNVIAWENNISNLTFLVAANFLFCLIFFCLTLLCKSNEVEECLGSNLDITENNLRILVGIHTVMNGIFVHIHVHEMNRLFLCASIVVASFSCMIAMIFYAATTKSQKYSLRTSSLAIMILFASMMVNISLLNTLFIKDLEVVDSVAAFADLHVFERIIQVIYYTFVSASTVGYGDIYPISCVAGVISFYSSFIYSGFTLALAAHLFLSGLDNRCRKIKRMFGFLVAFVLIIIAVFILVTIFNEFFLFDSQKYWLLILMTISTIGYGNVYTVNPIFRSIICFMILVSTLFNAGVIAAIFDWFRDKYK